MTEIDFQKAFYETLRIRRVEERIADLYSRQEMRCPVHLSIGQEAVPVGVSAHLTKTDFVMGGHRSHAHYLAQGGDLKAMMAELHGKRTGCTAGKGGSMHLIDLDAGFLGATPIVASVIPIATGTAFSAQMRKTRQVAVVYFGDGSIEEGIFHESLNFAALKSLPIVYVCENNGYSVYSPMDVRQPKDRKIHELARGYGMEAYGANGNDMQAISHYAETAITRAREGLGPTLLEFETYRFREHCGPNCDDSLGYRPAGELDSKIPNGPLVHLEQRLRDSKQIDDQTIAKFEALIKSEIDEAIDFAWESPSADPETVFDHIYAPASL